MPTEHARAKLAEAQLELVEALTGEKTSALDGFDESRLQAAAVALIQKRARSVGRAWPALRRSLGLRFMARFTEFAATTSWPRQGGPLADGRAFAQFLEARNELPDEGRLETLAVDLRYAVVHDGLAPRRLPTVRLCWFRTHFQLAVAIHIPRVGEYFFSLSPLSHKG